MSNPIGDPFDITSDQVHWQSIGWCDYVDGEPCDEKHEAIASVYRKAENALEIRVVVPPGGIKMSLELRDEWVRICKKVAASMYELAGFDD